MLGKYTVFSHSTCRVSNAVVHEYADYYMLNVDNDATVLSKSPDEYDQKVNARGFIDRHASSFPTSLVISEPWEGTPAFLIYPPAGELRAAQSGSIPANTIEASIKKKRN